MNPNPDHPDLPPWLKAGILAGAVLAVLEVFSNLIPVVGFIITEPLAIITYYLQGVMAARYTLADPRRRPGSRVAQAALSGLATGVTLAVAATLVEYVILVPLTLGSALVALPFSIANSLMDIAFNLGFAAIGAWLYGRLGRARFAAASVALLGCSLAALCLVLVGGVALLAALGLGGLKDLIHLPFIPTLAPH